MKVVYVITAGKEGGTNPIDSLIFILGLGDWQLGVAMAQSAVGSFWTSGKMVGRTWTWTSIDKAFGKFTSWGRNQPGELEGRNPEKCVQVRTEIGLGFAEFYCDSIDFAASCCSIAVQFDQT